MIEGAFLVSSFIETYFPTVVSSRYWSSTTQFNPAGTSGWFNDFQNAGISSYDLKTISHNVICVRGTGTLGLNQSSLNKTGFIVYPNPTQDKLNIVCDSTLNKIQITDVQGRIIKIIAPKSETNSIVVEVSKLEHGTYFVTITGDSGISTQQFIKL